MIRKKDNNIEKEITRLKEKTIKPTQKVNELLENPIFKSIEAAKNDHVFVNAVDPLAQGGTAWSKVKFLDAAITNLTK